jgi:hypothetical protein
MIYSTPEELCQLAAAVLANAKAKRAAAEVDRQWAAGRQEKARIAGNAGARSREEADAARGRLAAGKRREPSDTDL